MQFSLEKNIVSRAIKEYCAPEGICRLEAALAASKRQLNNARLVYKLRFYIALCQADAALIWEVLEILPEEKRRFFILRYQEKIPITFIAPKLHQSPKQLAGWHKELCALFCDLLRGTVSERILSPEKLRIAKRHLDALLAVAKEEDDSTDRVYIAELQRRSVRLDETRRRLAAYVEGLEQAAERAALVDWMRDSSLTYVELAYAHHVSEATARRYVLRFKDYLLREGKG